LPQAKKKDGQKANVPGSEQPPPSKAQLRKLKQVQMKHERRQNISQVRALLLYQFRAGN
jgi:hypothetical protein